MLVYTLNKYIKQPEPDPEPWSYLDQLIKFEDEAYQEEVKKSKTEKVRYWCSWIAYSQGVTCWFIG